MSLSEQRLIRDFSAEVTLFNCVEPSHPLYPTLELEVVVKDLDMGVSIQFIEDLLRLQRVLTEDWKEEMFEYERKKEGRVSLAEKVGEGLRERIRQSYRKREEAKA